MQIIQRYNIHIDVCHSFKGVWLDRGEIDKIGRIQSAHIEEDDNKNHYKKSV
jgi:Zn-finger nucleic acid-binding protein